jgi:hypothetical protein
MLDSQITDAATDAKETEEQARARVKLERAAARKALLYFRVYHDTPQGAEQLKQFLRDQFPLPALDRPLRVLVRAGAQVSYEPGSDGEEGFFHVHTITGAGIHPARIPMWRLAEFISCTSDMLDLVRCIKGETESVQLLETDA